MALSATLFAEAADILSLDDLSASKAYYIRSAKGGYLYANAGKTVADGRTSPTADDAHRWAVAKGSATGQVFIYNLSAEAFLTAAEGACPLTEESAMVQLLPSGEQGQWIGYAEGSVIALSSSAAGQIILQGENAQQPDLLSFEEAGELSKDVEMSVAAKAAVYETNRTDVPVISTIGTRISALDELTDGLTFLLYSTGMSRYAYDAGGALSFNATQPAKNNITVMPYVFVAHKVGDAWTFSTMEGAYISGLSGSTVSTSDVGTTFTVTASSTAGSFNFYNAASSLYLNAQSAKPVGWNASEGNSRYQIIPVTLTNSDRYYPVTYLCYETDGEHTRLMDTQTYAKTTNRLSPPTFTGYRRTALLQSNGEAFATTTLTGPAVAVCTYTQSLRSTPLIPTTIKDGEFADTTHWYRLRVDGKYLQWYADAPGHYYLFSTSRPTMDDADLWCFVGNNIDGYRIYNRAAGTALSLALLDEPLSSDLPFLCDGAFKEWTVSNGSSAGNWYVAPVGTKNKVYLANDGQGKLSVYSTAANVNIDDAAAEMQAFAEDAAANLGNRVGQYDGAEADALIAAAESYTLTEAGFNTLQAAYNDFALNATRVALREDMLYRFINAATTDATLTAVTDATALSQTARSESERAQLWRLLPLGNSGAYYLLNPENGNFLGQTQSSRTPALVAAPTTHNYTIANASNTIAHWTLRDAGSTSSSSYVTLNDDGGVVGAAVSKETARWFIEPARTFTVETVPSAEGIAAATLCLPYSVSLPGGIDAFAVSAKGESSVELVPFEAKLVPANTPCLLVSSVAGSFQLTETSAEGTAPEGNLLSGIAVRIADNGEELYVLDANAKFVPASSILAAYTAVLPREAGDAESLSLVLPTGISAVEGDKAGTSTWYDLSGRRLLTAPRTNGVYIRNGKKILVR